MFGDAQKNRLIETVLLSTHNIYFSGEIKIKKKTNFTHSYLEAWFSQLPIRSDIFASIISTLSQRIQFSFQKKTKFYNFNYCYYKNVYFNLCSGQNLMSVSLATKALCFLIPHPQLYGIE